MSGADTIFAPATLKGQSGLAVVRVSGPLAFSASAQLCGAAAPPRVMALRQIVDPADGFVIDEGLVVRFTGPNSFTGEDVVEFQVHGSQAVVDALCGALSALDGLRFAEEGEFTARAFRNGRLDLTQVEGLADLIAAQTREQHRLANRVLTGELAETVERWRTQFLDISALLAATIDFADEEIPEGLIDSARVSLTELIADLQKEISGYPAARRIRDGLEVAIVGAPNVGKSTLLNRLAGRDAAITSDVAGTTRDVVEISLVIEGRSVSVLDTAGVREAEDSVEEIGIARTLARAEAADVRVFLVDDPADVGQLGVCRQPQDIVALSKGDLRDSEIAGSVSGRSGEGVDWLFAELADRIVALSGTGTVVSHARQLDAVQSALSSSEYALATMTEDSEQVDIAAEHLRSAVHHLDSLIGRIDVEEVLGKIFSTFCIGK